MVRLRQILLEVRTVNITSEAASVFKIFEDFTFVAKLREEMAEIEPYISQSI